MFTHGCQPLIKRLELYSRDYLFGIRNTVITYTVYMEYSIELAYFLCYNARALSGEAI
jgi:hypothetical protein